MEAPRLLPMAPCASLWLVPVILALVSMKVCNLPIRTECCDQMFVEGLPGPGLGGWDMGVSVLALGGFGSVGGRRQAGGARERPAVGRRGLCNLRGACENFHRGGHKGSDLCGVGSGLGWVPLPGRRPRMGKDRGGWAWLAVPLLGCGICQGRRPVCQGLKLPSLEARGAWPGLPAGEPPALTPCSSSLRCRTAAWRASWSPCPLPARRTPTLS